MCGGGVTAAALRGRLRARGGGAAWSRAAGTRPLGFASGLFPSARDQAVRTRRSLGGIVGFIPRFELGHRSGSCRLDRRMRDRGLQARVSGDEARKSFGEGDNVSAGRRQMGGPSDSSELPQPAARIHRTMDINARSRSVLAMSKSSSGVWPPSTAVTNDLKCTASSES